MSRPAPGPPFVAVLERRGRFLTAERLFPLRGPAAATPRRGGAGGMVVSSANSSRAAIGGAREGDIVLVRPGAKGARVQLRIGRPDVARDVIEALLHDRGLPRRFPAAVEREAKEAGERVMAAPGERRDLTSLATFTIDPVSARDFDDAISAEDAGSGRARIWVHIADVTAHVREGSAIDREARRRSTSVYVPGTVEPMLPHALSSDACSLVPGKPRAAVTVELLLDGETVQSASFYRSLIRSDERLDYERVDRIFAGAEPAAAPWAEPLKVARRVAAALQKKRERSGGLALDSPEPEFGFDERGDVREIHGRVQTESHRLIEHLMIAANEAVAELLSKRSIPCLYRVHERPEPDRVERLADQLASLEVPTPPTPERMSSTEAAEVLAALSVKVEEHLRANAGRGRRALSSLVLRTLKQAYYSPQNLGHAGLHSSAYCHFTSPIRRYPDIVCHRALLSAVGAGEPPPRAAELLELGAWTSEREREAMVTERDGDDIAACFALERMLFEWGPDQILGGEITGLIGAGAFVAFDGPGREEGHSEGAEVPPFEGMLPVRLLRAPRVQGESSGGPSGAGQRRVQGRRDAPRGTRERGESREWWELNEEGTILRGERTGATLRLGDEVRVRVVRIEGGGAGGGRGAAGGAGGGGGGGGGGRGGAGDVASNRYASHRYELIERLECGVVLEGTEVKALRTSGAQLKDGYAALSGGELWLHSVHIPPYAPASRENHDPERRRKLLAHHREIERLAMRVNERGLTLVPTRIYFSGANAKVEIALARGKDLYDKRQSIRERETKRDMERAVREVRR